MRALFRHDPDAPWRGGAVVMSRPVLICLTQSALTLARCVRSALPGAEIHGLFGRVEGSDVIVFTATVDHLRALFTAQHPIIGICAAGILIRALAQVLADKQDEPPVLALAEDGSAIIPLLGGHRGANDLARTIAGAIGAQAAITTAGDLRLRFALDRPPAGWRVENPAYAKPVMADLLAGHAVGLAAECGDLAWLDAGLFASGAPVAVRITDRAVDDAALILHPPTLALGIGCARGAEAAELLALAQTALQDSGYSEQSIACVVSLDLKEDEPAVHALAAHYGVPARFFSVQALHQETARLHSPSEAVFRATGCYGVAEGAVLAAVGAAGALVSPKRKSANATVALGRLAAGLDVGAIGRARGALWVVGIGPGAPEWRTGEAVRVLAEADEIVGYRLYLDLVADLIAGKNCHAAPLGAETERVERALDLAAQGRKVALISSGDAGIYGLASLVLERIDRGDRPDWRRIALSMVPGVSALLAAAARLGAPLGHDFCAISLSDLLTPWDAIERRLHAAALGDFVVALYNPRAERRAWQLPAALAILAAARPADTPVAIARNLGRKEESIRLATLATLDPAEVDMLSLVLIGSSETRRLVRGDGDLIYTPRGYGEKIVPRKRA
jgi:cobalt-precorrin 5A hydrolase/precorrin-3B C17-methyltransferase